MIIEIFSFFKNIKSLEPGAYVLHLQHISILTTDVSIHVWPVASMLGLTTL